MLMDAAKMSEMIRRKKKERMEGQVDVVGPTPDMNALDVYDMEQKGRIQSTLDTPPKINADDQMIDENVGLSMEEKSRMARLRKYMDSLDV